MKKNKAGKQTKSIFITLILMVSLVVTSIPLTAAMTLIQYMVLLYTAVVETLMVQKYTSNASSIGKSKQNMGGTWAGGWASGSWKVDVGDPDVLPTGNLSEL